MNKSDVSRRGSWALKICENFRVSFAKRWKQQQRTFPFVLQPPNLDTLSRQILLYSENVSMMCMSSSFLLWLCRLFFALASGETSKPAFVWRSLFFVCFVSATQVSGRKQRLNRHIGLRILVKSLLFVWVRQSERRGKKWNWADFGVFSTGFLLFELLNSSKSHEKFTTRLNFILLKAFHSWEFNRNDSKVVKFLLGGVSWISLWIHSCSLSFSLSSFTFLWAKIKL